MRKTRLVILPTKCLHQMGFLLLFLSCPVIGDWGRIRPESENSHRAIQIDREGICALQRDPPGKLLNFLYENGSDQCQPSEELDFDGITKKALFREVRKSEERRVFRRERVTRESRESERREANDGRKDARKAMQRTADERRNIRKERRDMRGISQIRTRSTELRQTRGERQNGRAARRLVSARRISNEMKSRNVRERLHQVRRNIERQNERTEQHRRSMMEITSERATRTARERKERETERFFRSAKRENEGDNRRSLRLQNRESDVRVRKFREEDQSRQNEKVSSARKEQSNIRRSEIGRNDESSERRFSQIRKTRMMETEVNQRLTTIENRRDVDNKRSFREDIRERRIAPLNSRLERTMKIISTRASGVTKQQTLPQDINLEDKNPNEKSGGITKWMDLKEYESFKTGDWTVNCVIGAVVYFFSTRHIKAV